MSRYLQFIAWCALLLAGVGCGGPTTPGGVPPPAAPPPNAPPEPPSTPQQLAALALFESAFVHAQVTTSPLTYASSDGRVWFDGPCASGYGSLQGSLDGGLSPAKGTVLPTGSHTYAVSFNNCLVDFLSGITLHGLASTAYSAADWNTVTATVSADSVRAEGLAVDSELWEVTAHGSAVWTSVGSSRRTTTYTPATGSRLTNNRTGNVATFGGGSYSRIDQPPPQGFGCRWDSRFDNLKVAINGTEYTLNGSLETTCGSRGSPTYAGEIRIMNNGTLAARIYGDAGNARIIEVLVPLVPL